MNKTPYFFWPALAVCLLTSVLAGCGGGGSETTTAVGPSSADTQVVAHNRLVDTSKKGITAAWVGTGIGKTVSPADIRSQYNMPADLDGTGQVIAIVTAPSTGDPAGDLNYFSNYYKLPQCNAANPCFSRINLSSPTRKISAANDWAMEVALDVQWAHAVAPGAKIVLVTANSTGLFDMMNAVKVAAKIPGVTAVSMSWGGRDQIVEYTKTLDAVFAAAPGVAFFAATGDWGNQGKNQTYPSTSPYVTVFNAPRVGNPIAPAEGPQSHRFLRWPAGGFGSRHRSGLLPSPRLRTGQAHRLELLAPIIVGATPRAGSRRSGLPRVIRVDDLFGGESFVHKVCKDYSCQLCMVTDSQRSRLLEGLKTRSCPSAWCKSTAQKD